MTKHIKLKEEYFVCKEEYLRKSYQLSMVSYFYRNYKEGKDGEKMIKKIGRIITEFDVDDENT